MRRGARSAGTRARCRQRDGARTASFPIHDVKQRSLLRSRARCCSRVLLFLIFFFVGWVERQRNPSPPPPRAPVRWVSRRALNPSYEIRILRFFVPGTFVPGFFFLSFLLSFLIPDRGDGGAPGGGILYPVARVIARRHVCEAWAVPRNRNGASRRSTVTVLGPLRALGSGVASGSLARSRTSRQRFYEPPRDATSRSAFRKRF
jgi:hypothetical protein